MFLHSSLGLKLYFSLCVRAPSLPNRALVRAVTAYLQKHPTGPDCCATENTPEPPLLVGVNAPRTFHTLTSLHRSHSSSSRDSEMCGFDPMMLSIHTCNGGGVLIQRSISFIPI